MLSMMVRYWWTLVLRGLVAVIFGVTALIWPDVTVATLIIFFGAYALVDGAFAVVAATQQEARRWTMLLRGAAGIAIGLVVFFWPVLTALALLYLIAGWAMATGGLEIAAAIRLRKEIKGVWMFVLSGIASLVFGALMVAWPGAGAVALVWLIASYALIFGGLLIGLGLRLRSLKPRQRDDIAVPHGAAYLSAR